jgi:sensor domain CHASE-containing protein
MNLELTSTERTALHAAVLTRVRTIEGLIYGWESHPDEHSDFLIKEYTKELQTLKELEAKIF